MISQKQCGFLSSRAHEIGEFASNWDMDDFYSLGVENLHRFTLAFDDCGIGLTKKIS